MPKGRIHGARWSGYPVDARLVEVMVGPTDWKWCVELVGTLRKAVEVQLPTGPVYVDNADGRALVVFLRGQAPLPGFRLLPAFSVYDDPDAKQFYQAAF